MSGDGKCLFYRSGRNERSAYLLDLETGQEREVPNSRAWADRIGWWWPSPDHKSLLVAGQIVDKRGLYIIQTQTGEITPLALDEPGVEPAVVGNPFGSDYVAYFRHHSTPSKLVLVKHDLKQNREKEFELPGAADRDVSLPTPFPDGKYVFFNRKKAGEILYVVVGLELETGREKEFLSSKSPVKVLPNPTGDLVRFVTEDEQKRPVYALFAFANFELREIARRTVPENFRYVWEAWRGPYVILTRPIEGKDGHQEVWTLSVKTGDLKKTELKLPAHQSIRGINQAGDGKTLLLLNTVPRAAELWVMENLFPPVAAAK